MNKQIRHDARELWAGFIKITFRKVSGKFLTGFIQIQFLIVNHQNTQDLEHLFKKRLHLVESNQCDQMLNSYAKSC